MATGIMLSTAVASGFCAENPEPAKQEASCRGIRSHSSYVDAVTFSPGGDLLASAPGSHGAVKLWNPDKGILIRTLDGHRSVDFSSDGKILASGSSDNAVKLWNPDTGNLIRTLGKHSNLINSVCFSPDGKFLASGSSDETILLWSTVDGKLIHKLQGHSSFITSVAFSPDGRTLASGSSDKTVKLWDADTGKLVRTIKGHSSSVNSVAFSPDGKILSSGSSDWNVKLWDCETGKLIRALDNWPLGPVSSVSFSPDGSVLVLGSGFKAFLFEVETGKVMRTLEGHLRHVNAVCFSPGGKVLASGGMDGVVMLWGTAHGNLLGCLVDPKTVSSAEGIVEYRYRNKDGKTVTYNLPCGASTPPGTACTCDCVPASKPSKPSAPPAGSSGGLICTCDKVCTCVPIV